MASSELIGVAGEPINSGTDINVIAEAAGSCLSYDALFEGKKQREPSQKVRGNSSVQ